jgi:hypothetical protein
VNFGTSDAYLVAHCPDVEEPPHIAAEGFKFWARYGSVISKCDVPNRMGGEIYLELVESAWVQPSKTQAGVTRPGDNGRYM